MTGKVVVVGVIITTVERVMGGGKLGNWKREFWLWFWWGWRCVVSYVVCCVVLGRVGANDGDG